jgi:hypothetical protein
MSIPDVRAVIAEPYPGGIANSHPREEHTYNE